MHCLLKGLCRFHTLCLLHMTRQDVKSAVPKQPAICHGLRVPSVEEETCVAEAHGNDDHFEAEDNEVHVHSDPAHSRSPHTFSEPWTPKDVKHVTCIHKMLTAPCLLEEEVPSDTYRTTQTCLPKWLKARAVRALRYVCNDFGLVPTSKHSKPPTKDTCVDVLVEWASVITVWGRLDTNIPEQRLKRPMRPTGPPPLKDVTSEILDAVRNVNKRVKKPLWVCTVPRNIGDKAAGTPKADEWRKLSTSALQPPRSTFLRHARISDAQTRLSGALRRPCLLVTW
jgi:hypothetical protein